MEYDFNENDAENLKRTASAKAIIAATAPADRPIKDDGKRIQFSDGAVRSGHKGQGRFDLLPFRAIQRVAVIFEKGAAKYQPDNWLKGMPLRQFADSAFNHYRKAMMGLTDEDHWAMAAWNILAIVEYQERMAEGIMDRKWDDLPRIPENTDREHGD